MGRSHTSRVEVSEAKFSVALRRITSAKLLKPSCVTRSKNRPTWVCCDEGRSMSTIPTSRPLATSTTPSNATVAARTRRPSASHANRANPGAAASAAPKSLPHGGAAITTSVTASIPMTSHTVRRPGRRHTRMPARSTAAAVSCANVRFPSPDTLIPMVAE
jgi:hypothetical protein